MGKVRTPLPTRRPGPLPREKKVIGANGTLEEQTGPPAVGRHVPDINLTIFKPVGQNFNLTKDIYKSRDRRDLFGLLPWDDSCETHRRTRPNPHLTTVTEEVGVTNKDHGWIKGTLVNSRVVPVEIEERIDSELKEPPERWRRTRGGYGPRSDGGSSGGE